MLGTRPRRSYAQDQQGGGTTELDQLLANGRGFIKPGYDRYPRLELGGLGCPVGEKRFGCALLVVGSSIVTD